MKINKNKILIGSDFEMFLQDENGKIISAIPFNKGTKEHPEKIKGHPGCCIQRDGILQECNVPPVKIDQPDVFWANIELVKDYIQNSFAKSKGLKLVCCPTAILEPDQLQDDEAKLIGCSVDYNAWKDGEVNDKPSFDDTGLRSAGFHIHISYPEASIDDSILLMKLFDIFLTVPFVLIDKDKERRKLYGKAGSFRLCSWGDAAGFEARTLSNKAMESSESIDYVFHQLNAMIDYFNDGDRSKIDYFSYDIITAINNSDEELASMLCQELNILLPIQKQLV